MKKLFAILLAGSLALGSFNLQAGNGTKKAWAYTKIGYGGLHLFACMISPIGILTLATTGNTSEATKALAGIALVELPLGILSIQSGKRDLRRLKKKALKKKAAKEKTLLA